MGMALEAGVAATLSGATGVAVGPGVGSAAAGAGVTGGPFRHVVRMRLSKSTRAVENLLNFLSNTLKIACSKKDFCPTILAGDHTFAGKRLLAATVGTGVARTIWRHPENRERLCPS